MPITDAGRIVEEGREGDISNHNFLFFLPGNLRRGMAVFFIGRTAWLSAIA